MLTQPTQQDLAADNARLLKEVEQLKKLLALREEQLRLATLRKFAPSSEKSKFQLQLFDEVELEQSLDELNQQIEQEESATPTKQNKPRKKREGFSPDLPRVRVDLTLTDEEKAGAVNTFFSKVKEELDIIPARAQEIEYWQEKAVFGEETGENPISAATCASTGQKHRQCRFAGLHSGFQIRRCLATLSIGESPQALRRQHQPHHHG